MTLPYLEYPTYFPAGEETLFGILTEPVGDPNGVNVLTLCGGGWIPGSHRGSMWVRLGREYAEAGYRSFRFDYHGVGESTGDVRFDMNLPLIKDARAALSTLADGSSGRSVVVGTCFGGRTAGALAAVTRPAGVAFLAVPVLGAKSTGELMRRAASPRVLRNVFKAEHRRQYWKIIVRRFKRIKNAVASRGSHGRSRACWRTAAMIPSMPNSSRRLRTDGWRGRSRRPATSCRWWWCQARCTGSPLPKLSSM